MGYHGEGKASNQSWEEDDVRKRSCGEGQASQNGRQGFRRCSPEAKHLKICFMNVQAACSPWGCPRSGPKLDQSQSSAPESFVHSHIARFAKEKKKNFEIKERNKENKLASYIMIS